jgi:hypothetical protein
MIGQGKSALRKVALLVTIMMVMACTGTLYAQQHFGIKGAFNYSGFRKSPDLKAGYQIGVAGKKYLSDLGWFFQAEVNYSLEGVVNQPLEFINIPLLFGFDFSESFNMHFGYQSGILVGTRGESGYDYETYSPTINFGLEFYPTAKSVFGARYDYGLKDIDNGINTSIPITFEVYLIIWLR